MVVNKAAGFPLIGSPFGIFKAGIWNILWGLEDGKMQKMPGIVKTEVVHFYGARQGACRRA